MPTSEAEEIWNAFTPEQKLNIQMELIVIYTEVLNDYIQSYQADSSCASSDH